MKAAITAIWILCATVALAWLWGGNPDAVPRPPEDFAIWISDLFGAKNGEDMGRLEVWYMLTVSFIATVSATLLARYTLRFLKRPHTAQP